MTDYGSGWHTRGQGGTRGPREAPGGTRGHQGAPGGTRLLLRPKNSKIMTPNHGLRYPKCVLAQKGWFLSCLSCHANGGRWISFGKFFRLLQWDFSLSLWFWFVQMCKFVHFLSFRLFLKQKKKTTTFRCSGSQFFVQIYSDSFLSKRSRMSHSALDPPHIRAKQEEDVVEVATICGKCATKY